jgi:hypothetical protein
MADTDWFLEGKQLIYCSCDFGCPCEANAPPTYGSCEGALAMKVDEGHFGDVRLDNLIIAATYHWPRALHHCDGHMQPILEERTTQEQRDAIFTILSGEGQPAGTIFQIFSVIIEHLHDPLFLPIEFEFDMENCTGQLSIPGVVRASTEPIRNPVTDEEHRIVTLLPKAWWMYEAENASGTAKGVGDIKFDYAKRHCSLSNFALNQNGMAYTYEESRARYR